jgi:hypothetical protein
LEVIVPDLREGENKHSDTVQSLFVKDIFAGIFDVVPKQRSVPSKVLHGKSISRLRVSRRKDRFKVVQKLESLLKRDLLDTVLGMLPRKKAKNIREMMQLANEKSLDKSDEEEEDSDELPVRILFLDTSDEEKEDSDDDDDFDVSAELPVPILCHFCHQLIALLLLLLLLLSMLFPSFLIAHPRKLG